MMKFTIYGKGCSKCEKLTEYAQQAAEELGLAFELEKITDTNAIIDAGVLRTPALALNDEVVIEGSIASVAAIKKLLV